jgi:prepilin-type N-terminal cleavage/methylation domain-containing protein
LSTEFDGGRRRGGFTETAAGFGLSVSTHGLRFSQLAREQIGGICRRLDFPVMVMRKECRRRQGMTLTELLCTILIISILAGLYLGVIASAYVHIKKVLGVQ